MKSPTLLPSALVAGFALAHVNSVPSSGLTTVVNTEVYPGTTVVNTEVNSDTTVVNTEVYAGSTIVNTEVYTPGKSVRPTATFTLAERDDASSSSLTTVVNTEVSPENTVVDTVVYNPGVSGSTIYGSAQPTATITATQGSLPPVNSGAPDFATVVSSTEELSTFLSVLQQDRFSDLRERLTNGNAVFACLAPDNDAFETFLASDAGQRFQNDDEFARWLLEYHVMLGAIESSAFDGGNFTENDWWSTFYYDPSQGSYINSRVGGYTDGDGTVKIVSGYYDTSTVQKADIECRNGYVHIIDAVLTIPPLLQNALINGGFSSLLGALAKASKVQDVLGAIQDIDQPLILAPTNQAFENIGSALESLSAQDLANILLYHVSERPTWINLLEDGQTIKTVSGGIIEVSIEDGDKGPRVFFNGAQVVLPDLVLKAGFVHGIDQVLNPDSTTPSAEGAMSGTMQYGSASPVSNPPLTSGQPMPTTSFELAQVTEQPATASQSSPVEQQTGNAAVAFKVPVLGAVVAVGLVVLGI